MRTLGGEQEIAKGMYAIHTLRARSLSRHRPAAPTEVVCAWNDLPIVLTTGLIISHSGSGSAAELELIAHAVRA